MTELEKVVDGVSRLDSDIVANFSRALLDADDMREELAEQGDWLSLAHGLDSFKRMKAELDILIRAIEDDCAAHLPQKKVVVEGFATLERRSTTSRKWDSEGLLRYMVRDVLDPDHTGEINYDRIWDLIEALQKALPLTASLGWRVTALKELNMPVDSFSETSYGRQTITIQK
jgi:hypothetical protein